MKGKISLSGRQEMMNLPADNSFYAEANDEHDIAILLQQNEKKKISVFSLRGLMSKVKVPATEQGL